MLNNLTFRVCMLASCGTHLFTEVPWGGGGAAIFDFLNSKGVCLISATQK